MIILIRPQIGQNDQDAICHEFNYFCSIINDKNVRGISS